LVTLQAQVEVHLTSSAPTANYYEIVSQLARATNISSHDADWEDYEDLLDPLGEADISDNEVESQVLTQISKGENQLILDGFYLDGGAPLGGGFDVSFRRAAWIFIVSESGQLAESSPLKRILLLLARWPSGSALHPASARRPWHGVRKAPDRKTRARPLLYASV
jgi:hypothetical protein